MKSTIHFFSSRGSSDKVSVLPTETFNTKRDAADRLNGLAKGTKIFRTGTRQWAVTLMVS